jgi:hypothetical protein
MEHHWKARFQKTPAGVTIKSVLDNYLVAIGGEKAVKAVKQSLW